MNHYINLLEPGECHYLPATESNPLYKLGAMALVAVLVGWAYFSYQGLTSTIREGEKVEAWLQKNAEDVEEAKERSDLARRIGNARETLEGWSASRYDYPVLFDALVRAIPPPAERMQFTQLFFNETLVGLSEPRENPEGNDTAFHPVERVVRIELQGLLGGGRPDLMLDDYRSNLVGERDGLPLEGVSMRLEQRGGRRSPEGEEVEEVTPFSAEVDLTPREMRP